jgi:hypothetical protein
VLYRNLAEVALDAGWPDRAVQAAGQARALVQARVQDTVAMPELDTLQLRAIIAVVLTQRVCRHERNSAGLEAELLTAAQKSAIKTTPAELTAAANTVEDAVRAAVARCRAAPTPGKP